MTVPKPSRCGFRPSLSHGLGRTSRALAALVLAGGAPLVHAQEWAVSGFGTLGWAQSDREQAYQRFIDSDGSWRRDSKLGAQLDVSWTPQWSATAQVLYRPSERSDNRDTLQPAWLFGSWRPDNDTLIRLGKQRMPVCLNSENLEVGQTYDFVRLPVEMYTITPTQDFTGLYGSHTWWRGEGEFSVEAMYGLSPLWHRSHLRDLGTRFSKLDTQVFSLVANWRDGRGRWRLGWHHARSKSADGSGIPHDYPYVAPGFYLVQGAGVPTRSHVSNDVLVLGAELQLAPAWRLVAEAARNFQHEMRVAPGSAGGYLALIHQRGAWSPYVSLSRLVSLGAGARLTAQLDATVLPGTDPQTLAINASQRAAADAYPVVFQTSLAVGASYALSATTKLKLEWLDTRIGRRSSLIDSPAGGEPIRHQGVRVWSLNYNFVF
jgi:hypothetical protein